MAKWRYGQAVIDFLGEYCLAKAELSALKARAEEIRDLQARGVLNLTNHPRSPSDPVLNRILRLEDLEARMARLKALILLAEIGLDILLPRERAIIEGRYLTSPPVPVVALAQQVHVSIGGLYLIERRAMTKLARIWNLDDKSPAKRPQNLTAGDANPEG